MQILWSVFSFSASLYCAASGQAQLVEDDAASIKHLIVERWNSLVQKAMNEVGGFDIGATTRIISRAARPEIILEGGRIWIDGRQVKMGDPLSSWKMSLPGPARCSSWGDKKSGGTLCRWDQLGIEVSTSNLQETEVDNFSIFMNVDLPNPWYSRTDEPPAPPPNYLPAHSFRGYLEIDGFGVDRNTKFWELAKSVDPAHNLRFDLSDCSFPHGRFGGAARLFLRLHGANKNSTVLEFTINSTVLTPDH